MESSTGLRRFFSYAFVMLVFLVVVGTAGAAYVFFKYGRGLPDYQQLAKYEPPVITRLYASDGKMFAEYAHEKRVYVPLEVIPKRIVQTFLAAEDKNFYEHFGIDFSSILRAALMNVKRSRENKRLVGGSTITQQVAKNFLLNEISNELSIERKIKEAILSLRIEYAYTKKHILELYLNEIYLGGSYGVAAAALRYFDKALDELTIAEAAFLAGLPKAPSRYNPVRSPKLAKERRDWVIRRMFEERIITAAEAREATSQPIVVHRRDPRKLVKADYFAEEVRRTIQSQHGVRSLYEGGLMVRTTLDPRLQSFAVKALRRGLISYDRRHGWRGAVTTLEMDPKSTRDDGTPTWMHQLREVLSPAGLGPWKLAVVLSVAPSEVKIGFNDGETAKVPLSKMKWARKYIDVETRGDAVTHPNMVVSVGDVVTVSAVKGKSGIFALCQIPNVSGGIIAMDPHTGKVLAMSGGYSFDISQYNRATQAWRQPGSTFKTFVYLAGLEKGISPSTKIMDSPFAINMGFGLGVWKPENYDEKFLGPTTMRVGFENSRNTVTVRLAHELVGIKRIANIVQKLGVMEKMPRQLAMVLGAGESTLLRMTTGYARIANGGKLVNPTLIERIQDRTGKTIWAHNVKICKDCSGGGWFNQPIPELMDTREQIIDPIPVYQITSFLEGAVRNTSGKLVHSLMERPYAGKTGTSNDFFDTWFIGYSSDLVVGVFVGFDDPRTLGPKEYGVRVATPIFAEFMQEALKDTPPTPFRIPPGVRLVKVNRHTGRQTHNDGPGVIMEAFRFGTQVPQQRRHEEDGPAMANDDSMDNGIDPEPITEIPGTGGVY